MPDTKNDRDMLIRLDAETRHMDEVMKEVRLRQSEQERNLNQLTDSVARLTYNIGAMLEGMKDIREAMQVVNQHEQRLGLLELWKQQREVLCKEIDDKIEEEMQTIKSQLAEDKKEWQPVVSAFAHWRWLIAGAVAVVGVTGWPFIAQALRAIANV